MEDSLNEREQSFEELNENTVQKMGEAAIETVDLDKIVEEVEDEVLNKEDPNAGYELFMAGRDLSKEMKNGE